MVMRTTLKDTARRAQMPIARATMRQADDDHYWQEIDVDVMTSETHTGIERVENYGFTSVPMKQDEEEGGQKQKGQGQQGGGAGSQGQGEQGEQPKGDAAEPVIGYLGSHSHPVALAVGDRRFQMMNKKPGDVAIYDHQQQQLHFNKDGAYLTSLPDKTIKLQLAAKGEAGKPKQEEGQQAGGNEQKKEKPKGQQPRYTKSSTKFVDVTPEVTRAFGKRSQLGLEDGNGYVDCVSAKVYLGIEMGKGKHARVLTEDGISDNVYARLGAGPLPFPPAPPSAAAGGSINQEMRPRQRCFFAETAELDALISRVEMLEQQNARLSLLIQKLLAA